jgi:hypothetical protein
LEPSTKKARIEDWINNIERRGYAVTYGNEWVLAHTVPTVCAEIPDDFQFWDSPGIFGGLRWQRFVNEAFDVTRHAD